MSRSPRHLPRLASRRLVIACLTALLTLWCAPARAELILGVFAPAAPLENTEERILLGAQLAEHLSASLPGKPVVRSRVFVRASDFDAAKDLSLVLVDGAYLASPSGDRRAIAVTADVSWRLVVGPGIDSMKALSQHAERRLLVATGGDPDRARRLANGVFRGEASGFFGDISSAPDSASALAALALGKAACALLPLTDEARLPAGVTVVHSTEPMPGMVLAVMSPRVPRDQLAQLEAAARSFRSETSGVSLRAADQGSLAAMVQRLSPPPPRRGPMATLPLRALVNSLLMAPHVSMPRVDARRFVARPEPSAGFREGAGTPKDAPAPGAP